MENGHIEIHDPISNCKDLSSTKPGCTTDTESMEDTQEFRLMMAYAQRRRLKKTTDPSEQGSVTKATGQIGKGGNGSPQVPDKTTKNVETKEEKKKKKKKKGLKRILSCIRPQNKHDELSPVPAVEPIAPVVEKLKDAVSRLAEIVSEVPFVPPEVETDSPDDVEKVIGLLLREAGDRLNEEEELKAAVSSIFWNYSFFNRLITALLTRMGLLPSNRDAPGPQASPKTQIAITCEVTSRLSAADTLPMSRLLDHGARYLQEHYSSWVQQQGGYEEAFYSDDEDNSQ